MLKRIGIFLAAAFIGAFCLELGERLSIPGVHASHSLLRTSIRIFYVLWLYFLRLST